MQRVRVLKKVEKKQEEEEPKEDLADPFLVVLAGPRFGETLALRRGENVVGSDARADLYFPAHSLEKRHFLLTHDSEVLLKAEKGTTLVNNSPVIQVALHDGDLIRAGGILMQYVEGSSCDDFFVGQNLFRCKGKNRRRYDRFTVQATADIFVVEQGVSFKGLTVKNGGRGGVSVYSKENLPPGSEVQVSIYVQELDRRIVGKLVPATVATSVPGKEANFLVGILFNDPISADHQPDLYRYWTEMEKKEKKDCPSA